MLVGFASSPARARSTSAAAVVVCELRGGTAGSPDTNDTYIRSNARAAAAVVKKAIDQHVTLIEVQFPPVQNMATAALNQLLDANRDITREFVRDFVPTLPSQRLNIVFPDDGEARLAQKVWGDVPFFIRSIPSSRRRGSPSYVRPQSSDATHDRGLIVCVNPGFNISEWINLELLSGADPVVIINGDLDKVRGGYYPRLFYPGLHAVKDRFLANFEPVYYVKYLSNGGTLLKTFDDDWTLRYTDLRNETRTLQTFANRPSFRDVEQLLRQERNTELQNRQM